MSVDPVVQDQELVAVLGRKQARAASRSGSSPGAPAPGRAARSRPSIAASGSKPAGLRPGLVGQVVAVGVIVIVQEVDHAARPASRPARTGSSPARRNGRRSGRSAAAGAVPGPPSSRRRSRGCVPVPADQRHGRFARDAAHAEDLDLQPLTRPRRAKIRGLERVAVEPRSDTPAAGPASRPPPPAGRGTGLHPEHVQRVLRHERGGVSWPGRSSTGVSSGSAVESQLTTRSGRTPCWRRPCGGRSRGG